MNIIDISAYQAGMNLPAVFNANPDLDGVIVKSSGGVSWAQKTCDPWIQDCIKAGKLWGFYHFLNDDGKGADPITEADFWYNNCKNYFGHGIPFVDYEGAGLRIGPEGLKQFLDRILELSGIRPVVYTYSAVLKQYDFSKIVNANYGLWVANYPSSQPQYGFKNVDCIKVPIGQWPFAMGWQYTGNGRLNGYTGALDMSYFAGDAETWAKYAGSQYTKKQIDTNLLADVLAGKYGNGSERREQLKAAGYNPEEVQNMIHAVYEMADNIKSLKKLHGKDFYLLADSLSDR